MTDTYAYIVGRLIGRNKLLETILLVISPLVIVEIFKLLKINATKDE